MLLPCSRFIDMAESLCQKRALEAFRLDASKWGGKLKAIVQNIFYTIVDVEAVVEMQAVSVELMN